MRACVRVCVRVCVSVFMPCERTATAGLPQAQDDTKGQQKTRVPQSGGAHGQRGVP